MIEIWKAQRKMQLRQGEARCSASSASRSARQPRRRQGRCRATGARRSAATTSRTRTRTAASTASSGISYPNVDDAERGYRSGLIDAGQWADIFLANLRGDTPPSYTVLGGRVGIHGFGGRPYVPVDWTEGCIAVSNDEIEFIYDRVPVGTPVIINE